MPQWLFVREHARCRRRRRDAVRDVRQLDRRHRTADREPVLDGSRPAHPAARAPGRRASSTPRPRRVIEVACDAGRAGRAASRAAGVAALGHRRGLPRDRRAGDADARAEPRPDRRRRPQRQRQVLVRRGPRAADDRPPEALGEAPEGVDGDLAVPAPRRADAAHRASSRSKARGRPVALEQEWAHGATHDDATRPRGRRRGARRARLGPRRCPRSGRSSSYAELATMFDTLSSLYEALTPVLGLGDIDELIAPARRDPAGLRQPAQGGRPGYATRWSPGWTPTTSTPRWSPPRSAPASPTSTRSSSCSPTRPTTAATPRSCAASPGLALPSDEEIRDAFKAAAGRRGAPTTTPPRPTPRARRTSPRCCAARSRSATRSKLDRRLPGLRHRRTCSTTPGRSRRPSRPPRSTSRRRR